MNGYTKIVYTIFMKNITLSADESLIEQARLVARSQHKTLNTAFREWLREQLSAVGCRADSRSSGGPTSYAQ